MAPPQYEQPNMAAGAYGAGAGYNAGYGAGAGYGTGAEAGAAYGTAGYPVDSPYVATGAEAAYGSAGGMMYANGGLPPVPPNAVVHTTGCATGTCVAAGCAAGGETVMSLVGPGNGDYVTETTYRYVGAGQGNLAVVQPRTFLWGRVLGLAVLVAGGVTAAVMLQKPQEPEVQQHKLTDPVEENDIVCTYWGDPHILSFDGARPSFYGNGEYYVVKSRDVTIQGRYMGTKYTAGLAATNKISVGGSFMQGHTLTVGSLEDGPIRIDGVPVLTQFGESREIEGVGTVSYTGVGELVDQATQQWEKKVVKLEVPHVLKLEVFRWSNYLDLRITMPKQDGVDGGCGNMNGLSEDDSTEEIFSRIGARVPHGELLFHQRTHEELSEVEEKLLTMCEPRTLAKAQQECMTALASWETSPTTSETKSCMLDECYGSNEHTLRMAKQLGLVPAGSAAMQTH